MDHWEHGYPLDTFQRWKEFRQGNEMARFPGFSCQFLKEDDAHEKEEMTEPKEAIPFRASTTVQDEA